VNAFEKLTGSGGHIQRLRQHESIMNCRKYWEQKRQMPSSRLRPVRLAYQPPANNTFLSEQISNQPAVLLSEQTSTSHQPTSQTNRLLIFIIMTDNTSD
jgi:hypothetical protein